jgi:beta-galactosidase
MVNQAGVVSVAKGGDWSESYIVDLFDWHLMVSESQPGFAGNAQWAFKDFATPLRAENPIPYINQKGLVDREGRPKEAYWVFKSRWSDDPVCHIYGHSWTERHGAPGSRQPIRAYCNTESAQLVVNGVALEEKLRDPTAFPAAGLHWEVDFDAGLNRLEVIGRNGGETAATDELEVRYSEEPYGKAADIRLSASAQDGERVLIEAVIIDAKGRRVHSADERIYLSHTNPGSGGFLVKDHGTPDKSAVIQAANGRAVILFDRGGAGSGAIIEARTQTLKGSTIRLP